MLNTRTGWFTESASPMPNLAAWSVMDDGTLYADRIVALVLQRRYPVHASGHRIVGEDWIDSRVTFATATPAGDFLELDMLGDLLGLYDTELPEQVIRQKHREQIEEIVTEYQRRTQAVRAGDTP